MTNKILVPLAEGFEEIEAVTIVDVLRRAELDVTLAGLDGAGPQRGSRGVLVQPDCAFADLEPGEFDVIVLPGGLGGTVRMLEEPRLLDALRELHARGGLTAAVCAAVRRRLAFEPVPRIAVICVPLTGAPMGGSRRPKRFQLLWTTYKSSAKLKMFGTKRRRGPFMRYFRNIRLTVFSLD